jgi:hypothetical protein
MNLLSNKYLYFFFKVFILIIIIAIIDQIGGGIIRHFYFKQITGTLSRTTYAIDSTQANILVFGSSRANHHYVPEIFEDQLNMSFYNTGRDGNYIMYNYAIFKAILKRHTPKIVLFDICPDEIYSNGTNYDNLASILPYYKTHPEIRNIVELRSPIEKYKMLSEIYPFNSIIINICMGNIGLQKYRMEDRKGFVPLKKVLINSILETRDEYYSGSPDINKINALNDIIYLCKKNKIQLIFIQSPEYANVLQNETSRVFEQIVKNNNATYWNFVNDPDFIAMPNFFQDQRHLNEKGAIYFSQIVAKRIAINNINQVE